MESWRLLRQQPPALFSQGVLVWGQPESTMDEIISCWLSDLIYETEAVYALQQVDCFAGEWTELVKARNYLNNQPKHCIGPRITSRQQVTDIRFAKLAKAWAFNSPRSLPRRGVQFAPRN